MVYIYEGWVEAGVKGGDNLLHPTDTVGFDY